MTDTALIAREIEKTLASIYEHVIQEEIASLGISYCVADELSYAFYDGLVDQEAFNRNPEIYWAYILALTFECGECGWTNTLDMKYEEGVCLHCA